MNSRISYYLRLGTVTFSVVWLVGCTSGSVNPPVSQAPAGTTNVVVGTAVPEPGNGTNDTETTQAPTAVAPAAHRDLPPGAKEVADLAEAGVGESVLMEYVRNATNVGPLKVDEIIYLGDIGVPDAVVAELVKKGGTVGGAEAGGGGGSAPAIPVPGPLPAGAAPVAVGGGFPQQPQQPLAQAEPAQAINTPVQPGADAGVSAIPNAPTVPNAPVVDAVAAAPVQPVLVNQPVAVPTTYSYYYNTLSPYGSWVEVPDYGWCWRPSVAVVDPYWQPYCHRGHWVYTDCGWYWHSDYSWGWMPFHYGRWYRHARVGWIWYPDSVWGPAWVTWRSGGDACGWAPLPPAARWDAHLGLTFHGSRVAVGFDFGLRYDCFTFVSYNRFCDPSPWRHAYPRHEVVRVYNHTTIINQYSSDNHGGHARVVNAGVPPSHITRVTRQEIRPVPIHNVSSPQQASRRPDRGGAALAVYRPSVPTPQQQAAAPTMGGMRRGQEAGVASRSTTAPAPTRGGSDRGAWAPATANGGSSSAQPAPVTRPSRLAETPASPASRGSAQTSPGSRVVTPIRATQTPSGSAAGVVGNRTAAESQVRSTPAPVARPSASQPAGGAAPSPVAPRLVSTQPGGAVQRPSAVGGSAPQQQQPRQAQPQVVTRQNTSTQPPPISRQITSQPSAQSGAGFQSRGGSEMTPTRTEIRRVDPTPVPQSQPPKYQNLTPSAAPSRPTPSPAYSAPAPAPAPARVAQPQPQPQPQAQQPVSSSRQVQSAPSGAPARMTPSSGADPRRGQNRREN